MKPNTNYPPIAETVTRRTELAQENDLLQMRRAPINKEGSMEQTCFVVNKLVVKETQDATSAFRQGKE